jgi:hypothetical protein
MKQRDVRAMRLALLIAIDSEQALISAHQTKLRRWKGNVVYCFPKEHRALVAVLRRRIAHWKRLLMHVELWTIK